MRNFGINFKILLLLLSTGVIFLLLLSVLYLFTNKQENQMLEAAKLLLKNEANSIISLKTTTLPQVAYDYTFWDDFANNIKKGDTNWYNNNITTILKTYHVDYVCVFDASFKLVHEASSETFNSRGFISKETLDRIRETRFLNYFQVISNGITELSGASIHFEIDSSHKQTRPSGYLFLAKSWSTNELLDLKNLTGSKIEIFMPSDSNVSCDLFSIKTENRLFNWDEKEVAKIVFTRKSDSIDLFHKSSLYMMLILLCSIIATYLIWYFASRNWISKPLRLVNSILKSEDLTLAKKLEYYGGEFKDIGLLFNEFIHQKAELLIAIKKAEESDRLKSAFLANMSHEIRTPMNGILGFAEILKEPNLTGDEQQKYIGIIEESGARMLSTINDIVDISRIESGHVEVCNSETNINELIESIYAFFKPEVDRKGIQLSTKNSLSSKEAFIKTDNDKVDTILSNLVKNAVKFTKEGSINFGYEKKGDFLEFFVKDTGKGILEEHQRIIFERFRQTEDGFSRGYEGSGLGLSISKAYVEMLGGKIWVESGLEKGSTFYFTIPYNAVTEEKKLFDYEVPYDGIGAQINGLNILIAEDNEQSEILLSISTVMFSKKIFKATTGEEAVEICRANPDIDLVFMDIKMPQMNGYEATTLIRQFNKDVIIIAQTAYALIGDKEKAINAGCNDYVTKPLSKAVIQGLILKYFSK